MTINNLARYVDHTLLKPEATRADIATAVAEAAELDAYSVCLSPSALPIEVPEGLRVTTVIGFPSGAHQTEIKVAEARLAVNQGADELDMVIDVGAAIAGDYDAVRSDIEAVRDASPHPTVLKVIIESATLSDKAIVAVSRAAETAGADFVKTSTGFHPDGGASVHAVALIKRTVEDRLGIKASGGIRTRRDAEAMIAAGATRLGLSQTRTVVAGEATDSLGQSEDKMTH